MSTKKPIEDILVVAQSVQADGDFLIAFDNAFNRTFKPIFRTLTGLDFDPSLTERYSKNHQTLIKSAKESFEPIFQKQQLANAKGMDSDIAMHDYSAKSFVLIGNTKAIKDDFKVNGRFLGRFNKSLTVNGEKHAGWVFPLKFKPQVQEILDRHKSSINPFSREDEEPTSDSEQTNLF